MRTSPITGTEAVFFSDIRIRYERRAVARMGFPRSILLELFGSSEATMNTG
jgi:hypothetical protein